MERQLPWVLVLAFSKDDWVFTRGFWKASSLHSDSVLLTNHNLCKVGISRGQPQSLCSSVSPAYSLFSSNHANSWKQMRWGCPLLGTKASCTERPFTLLYSSKHIAELLPATSALFASVSTLLHCSQHTLNLFWVNMSRNGPYEAKAANYRKLCWEQKILHCIKPISALSFLHS